MSTKQERLSQILNALETRHFMNMGELAREFGVSEMTVRRDTRELANQGLVRLVYGGVASPYKNGDASYSAQLELAEHTQEKQDIARYAAELIAPGDVIFLDSGTTIQQFAECIPSDAAYTIICYSLNTLNVVSKLPNCTVISPGGVFSPRSLVFSGPDTVNVIRKYRANKAFIGATGYEMRHGLTCSYVEDAPLKQAVMESSVEKILLMDSSKFGKVSTCNFAEIGAFSAVITDGSISDEYAQHIRAQGTELMIVEKNA